MSRNLLLDDPTAVYESDEPDEPDVETSAADDAKASSAPNTQTKQKAKGKKIGNTPSGYEMHRTFLNVTTRAKGLTSRAVLVWLVLWDDTDRQTGLATSAQSWIADRAGLSLDTVQRAMKELIAKGLLVVEKRGCNRHHQISVYRIKHE